MEQKCISHAQTGKKYTGCPRGLRFSAYDASPIERAPETPRYNSIEMFQGFQEALNYSLCNNYGNIWITYPKNTQVIYYKMFSLIVFYFILSYKV